MKIKQMFSVEWGNFASFSLFQMAIKFSEGKKKKVLSGDTPSG
jgi:hypothetical protein